MLRNVETQTATATTAGMKVGAPSAFTAEEIAKAIAELEKEQQGAASEQEEAAQLSSILEQLQLELPAAKVAEQVQKARVARQLAKKRRYRNLVASMAAGIGCLAIAGGIWVRMHQRRAETTAIPAATAVVPKQSLTAQNITPAQLVVTDQSGGDAVTRTLAEVPDGVRVHLPNSRLMELLGRPALYSEMEAPGMQNDWVVFRKGNVVYLRGYTATRRTRDALRVTPALQIYSTNTMYSYTDLANPIAPVPIILPLREVSPASNNRASARSPASNDWADVQSYDGATKIMVGDPDKVVFGK